MGAIRFGPSGLPSRDSPEEAVRILVERGYTACEIDFEGGFWMKKPFAAELREQAIEADIALSIHAPIAAFLGHVDREGKLKRALGMLDHTAGLAVACGVEVVVIHPGFLLSRTHEQTIEDVVEQLGILRERLEAKERAVAFGVEMMGRVRDFGTAEDVFAIARRVPWVRPVIDFAHLHAVSDGAFLEAGAFAEVLAGADAVLPDGVPFHIHFSDIAFANRNETRHLPYGDGSLRAGPLREALDRFSRPATVISESPDEGSHQAIRGALAGGRV